jgi:protein phosphatase
MSAQAKDETGGFRWWGLTDKGPFRKNNEDAFLLLNFDENDVRFLGKEGEGSLVNGDFIFAVSDGMGGANAGEFASRIAVEKITELLPKYYREGLGGEKIPYEKLLLKIFSQIHEELLNMGKHYDECKGMGATLSLGWFSKGRVTFCHIGDSRIYHFKEDGLMNQLSEDHTHSGWLFREGKINEREARNHRDRNMLNQSLGGSHNSILPQVGSHEFNKGDRWVFCSDGLVDGLWDRGISGLVSNPPLIVRNLTPAKRLMQEALSTSGRDNTTVVVIEAV